VSASAALQTEASYPNRAAALDAGADDSFYRGKLAAASFFAKTILPATSATRVLVENVDTDLMDVDDDAF